MKAKPKEALPVFEIEEVEDFWKYERDFIQEVYNWQFIDKEELEEALISYIPIEHQYSMGLKAHGAEE